MQGTVVAIVCEQNGRMKTRLVHDFRRSLANAMIVCPERVILPRLRDAIAGALLVISFVERVEEVLQMVLDLSDAFKMPTAKDDEKIFLAGRIPVVGVEGFFY